MKTPKFASVMTLDVLIMVHSGNIRSSDMSSFSNNMMLHAKEKGRTIPKTQVIRP